MKRFLLPVTAIMVIFLTGCEKAAENTAAVTPVVAVAKVEREDLSKLVPIPGEFRPYAEVELHAKVSGYLQTMSVDFGDRVKAGQRLAVIEVPELRDQLTNAIAGEERAEVDFTNADLIYTRMQSVNKQHPDLVAQQDIDTAKTKEMAARAEIAAAQAEVGKYRTMVDYTEILAPFDGVITKRYMDPGALVEAGTSSSSAGPLLRISDNYRLRLDFPVSIAYVKDVKVGDEVKLRVDSLGGKMFTGKITRSTQRADFDTRTMMTELEVTNPDLEIVPGMYASVFFQAERHPQALAIPIQAVPPGQTSTVYVVNNNNEIEERPVTLGMDTPSKYEVLSGLKEGERVLVGSRAAFKPGEKVEPKLWQPESME
jgi:RND family efflux transporter MFP subunit